MEQSKPKRDFMSIVSEMRYMKDATSHGQRAEIRGTDSGMYKAQFMRWWDEQGRAEKEKEDDAMETIKRRLDEVDEMVASRRPNVIENTMDRMHTPRRQQVKRLAAITPRTYRRLRQKASKIHALQRFQYASTMVLIVARRCHAARKYLHPENHVESSSSARTDASPISATDDDSEFNSMNPVHTIKSTIGWDVQMTLTTQPQYRTTDQLKRILYMIGTNKAFSIFSSDTEMELAKMLSYECYDDGRIIAYQGRPPDRLYYIVSGRVNLVCEYELQTGTMTKSLGFLKKGSFTDTEELEKQWDRRSSLICNGPVEVLLLHKEDFFCLQSTRGGLPVDFLRSQYLFIEFPCHLFIQHPEAIECKYYGPEQLVAKEANKTKWMYVIKSGKCKCVRRQFVTDVKSDKKFSEKKSVDKLGYVKQPSHADAMIGAGLRKLVEEGQHNFDHDSEMSKIEEVEEANLAGNPYPTLDIAVTGNPHADTLGVGNPYADTLQGTSKDSPGTPCYPSRLTSRLRLRSSKVALPDIDSNRRQSFLRTPGESNWNVEDSPNVKNHAARRYSSRSGPSYNTTSPLPPLQSATGSIMDEPHEADGCSMNKRARPRRRFTHSIEIDGVTPPVQRMAYIQLDTMGTGDIFGLNDVASTASSAPSGVSVVSEGAEIIKINKRFFRTNAGIVTMLKLDTLVREFMSEEDASDNLERQETWLKYKTTLMERLAEKKYQDNQRWNRTLKPLSFTI